MGAMSKASKFV